MPTLNITRAVVLAAGTGSRLRAGGNQCPKPLRPVGGVPLLVRVLRTLSRAGVREAAIIVGYEGDRIRTSLEREQQRLGLDLEFIENENYLAKNGISLLAASEWVDRECYLSMSDHLYSSTLVERLAAKEIPAGACALGVDYDIPRCFDLDDATKVRVEKGRIVDIAKELPHYDALDTGVFRIGPSLIAELSKVADRHGDCSLSDGVKALSERGQFWATDIGDARWIDVDTPDAAVEAELLLRKYGDDLSGYAPREVAARGAVPQSLASAWQRVVAGAMRRASSVVLSGDAE